MLSPTSIHMAVADRTALLEQFSLSVIHKCLAQASGFWLSGGPCDFGSLYAPVSDAGDRAAGAWCSGPR